MRASAGPAPSRARGSSSLAGPSSPAQRGFTGAGVAARALFDGPNLALCGGDTQGPRGVPPGGGWSGSPRPWGLRPRAPAPTLAPPQGPAGPAPRSLVVAHGKKKQRGKKTKRRGPLRRGSLRRVLPPEEERMHHHALSVQARPKRSKFERAETDARRERAHREATRGLFPIGVPDFPEDPEPRGYEATLLFRPDLSEDDLAARTRQIKAFLREEKATLKRATQKKNALLSSPILGHATGTFVILHFSARARGAKELGRYLATKTLPRRGARGALPAELPLLRWALFRQPKAAHYTVTEEDMDQAGRGDVKPSRVRPASVALPGGASARVSRTELEDRWGRGVRESEDGEGAEGEADPALAWLANELARLHLERRPGLGRGEGGAREAGRERDAEADGAGGTEYASDGYDSKGAEYDSDGYDSEGAEYDSDGYDSEGAEYESEGPSPATIESAFGISSDEIRHALASGSLAGLPADKRRLLMARLAILDPETHDRLAAWDEPGEGREGTTSGSGEDGGHGGVLSNRSMGLNPDDFIIFGRHAAPEPAPSMPAGEGAGGEGAGGEEAGASRSLDDRDPDAEAPGSTPSDVPQPAEAPPKRKRGRPRKDRSHELGQLAFGPGDPVPNVPPPAR